MNLPKLSTNASVVAVFAIGTVCVAYLAGTASPDDNAFIQIVVTMAGGIIVQLLKQGTTDAKVDAGAVKREVIEEVGKLAKLLDLSNELGNSEGMVPDTSEEAAERRNETTKAVRAMMGN
mgnify:CR=1 FL=1